MARRLNKPYRTPGGPKKFAVNVRNKQTGRINVVRFGDPNLNIKRNDPARRAAFQARFGNRFRNLKGQKNLSPLYWSWQAWQPGTKWV
jgi:hypothetical protein